MSFVLLSPIGSRKAKAGKENMKNYEFTHCRDGTNGPYFGFYGGDEHAT